MFGQLDYEYVIVSVQLDNIIFDSRIITLTF